MFSGVSWALLGSSDHPGLGQNGKQEVCLFPPLPCSVESQWLVKTRWEFWDTDMLHSLSHLMLTVTPQNTPVVPAEQTETCAQGHKTSIQTQVCSPPKVMCPLLPNINLPKTENDTAVRLHKSIYFFALHTAGLHIPASLAVRYGLVSGFQTGEYG